MKRLLIWFIIYCHVVCELSEFLRFLCGTLVLKSAFHMVPERC